MKKGCAISAAVLAGLLVVAVAGGAYLLYRTETWEADLRVEVIDVGERSVDDTPRITVEVVPGQDTADALRHEQWMKGTASGDHLGAVAKGDVLTCRVRQEFTANTDFASGASTDIDRCRR